MGREGPAGHAVNPSMGLDGAIHGADAPAGPSHPTSDRFPVTDRRALGCRDGI
ncbi:Putative penicillin binding protein (fragment) [Stenotrophomonas thermophila]